MAVHQIACDLRAFARWAGPLLRHDARSAARLLRGVLFVGFLLPGLASAQRLQPEDIYQKLSPSVMTLHVQNAQGESYIGTAFLALDTNIAVTAWHVVSDAIKVSAKFSGDRTVDVDGLIDKDEAHDLALIHVNGLGRPEAPLCQTGPLVGSRAYVIGAPKGFDFSITDGLISQIQQIRGSPQYQVSCPISPGNSGGPVVNDRGEVVGIAAWTKTDAQNLNFAIPASFLRHLNPSHALTTWNQSAKAKTSAPEPNSQKVDASEGNVAELKHALNRAAGRHVTITVRNDDAEEEFSLVLPKDFVK